MFDYWRIKLLYLKKKFEKSPLDLYSILEKTNDWNSQQYKNHQDERVRKLLGIIERDVEFYKNFLSQNFFKFQGMDDLQNNLPNITRELLLERKGEFINFKKYGYYIHATSGSTGIPLKVLVSNEAEAYRKASLHYFLNWWGIKPGERFVYLWGTLPQHTLKKKVSIFVKNKMHNRLFVNVFEINEINLLKTVREIMDFKPKYMRGYTSAFLELAHLMKKNNIIFKNSFCKVIVVTAETLTKNGRDLIEGTFGCKVANEYGSSEVGTMGFECPDGSIHLNEYCNYIRTDENGNVFITDLFNDAMPIINYQNKDRIEISKDACSCGRSSRVIRNINGRLTDSIICTDGKHVSCFILNSIMVNLNKTDEFKDYIQQFRFKQKGNQLFAEILPNGEFDQKIENIIRNEVRTQICSDLEVSILFVEKLSREKSGKLRFFERVNV